MTLALWGCVAAFVTITLPHADVNSVRYLVPAVVFGSVLAGRFVSRLRLPSLGSVTIRSVSISSLSISSVGASLAGLTILVAYAATPWALVTASHAPAPSTALARWLADNQLGRGFGPYWDASIVTVVSQERVKVRPVIAEGGRLHALAYFASARWFSDTQAAPDKVFLVYEPDRPWGGVDDQSAATTFGPPERVATVGSYRVLVWAGDVGSRLGPLTTLPS